MLKGFRKCCFVDFFLIQVFSSHGSKIIIEKTPFCRIHIWHLQVGNLFSDFLHLPSWFGLWLKVNSRHSFDVWFSVYLFHSVRFEHGVEFILRLGLLLIVISYIWSCSGLFSTWLVDVGCHFVFSGCWVTFYLYGFSSCSSCLCSMLAMTLVL